MNTVKSKFSLFIYLHVFFIVGFICLCVYSFLHPELFKKGKWNSKDSSLALSIVLSVLIFIAFYTIAKLAYIIKIENRTVFIKGVFTNKTIYSSDIKSIDLFSKEDFY